MFLHGGGWRRGRRSDEKCGIFQPWLIARGCLFALVLGGVSLYILYIYIYYIIYLCVYSVSRSFCEYSQGVHKLDFDR